LRHEGARGLVFGLEIGPVVAAVGAVVATVSPFVEWWADALQSLQYWVTLLNVRIR
jgi:hypothetical protein